MRRLAGAAALCLLAALPVGAQERPTPSYVVLAGSQALLDATAELRTHRQGEGLEVVARVAGGEGREALRAWVARQRPTYVLLVGDVGSVPAFEVVHPGVAEPVATDRPYGDLDEDGLPDAAVGRLPFEDPALVRRVAARVIHYETRSDVGLWRKECALVAGEARYGPAVDALIEQLFTQVVSQGVAPGYDIDLTYANPRSSYCYPPEHFAERVAARLGEAPLVLAYVGHGDVRSVDSLSVPSGQGAGTTRHEVLSAASAARLERAGAAAPIFLSIACWTGRYEGPQRCIGEELMAAPGGPVAFFGASRVSHPIHNALLAKELVRELFRETGEARLGPALDRARRAMAKGRAEPDPVRLQMLMLGRAFVGQGTIDAEMPRHVDMYNLLGDPALRVLRPQAGVELSLPAGPATAGGALDVQGQVGPGYRMVTVTLETERVGSARPEARADETPRERYARANDKVLRTWILAVGEGGRFAARLELPARPGRYLVKAFAQSDRACAAGGVPLEVR